MHIIDFFLVENSWRSIFVNDIHKEAEYHDAFPRTVNEKIKSARIRFLSYSFLYITNIFVSIYNIILLTFVLFFFLTYRM